MIACERCENWFHPECVGLSKELDFETIEWWCNKCSKEMGLADRDYKAYRKIGNSGGLLKKRLSNLKVDKGKNQNSRKKMKI
jgi:hypothetical protein